MSTPQTSQSKNHKRTRYALRQWATEHSDLMAGVFLHASHRSGTLRDIERKNHTLDLLTLKKCQEYAGDVFGSRTYAKQIATYCAIHGSWREGWVPEIYFRNKVVRASTPVPNLSREKTLSAYFISPEAIPDIGYYCRKSFFSKGWDILPEQRMHDYLFGECDKVVFKANRSKQGAGVHIYSRENFNVEKVKSLGDGCFQSYIQPHSTVPSFKLPSVPTLRLITTMNSNGTPTARCCQLRIGRSHDTHVKANSIRVLVCMSTGELSRNGYMRDWTPILAHPDTQVEFNGLKYPKINDALELCINLHRKMPSFLTIGWDICLDNNGSFKVMEWNQLHGIAFAEAVNGPNFADLGWHRLSGKA